MDPITHGLVGLAAGSFSGGGSVLSNPFALGCLIGSVIPDGDIIYQYWGDYAYLKNHRGASHSIPGMAVISLVVSAMIGLFFTGTEYWNIFMWTFIGCLSHVGLDIFNSYGAKLFWPFYNKKIGSGLMLIVDPILVLCTIGIIIYNNTRLVRSFGIFGVFASYLLFRHIIKISINKKLRQYFNEEDIKNIHLIPSMKGFLQWDYIINTQDRIITGQIDSWGRKLIVRDKFDRTDDWIENAVMKTEFGKFFRDFSQHYHIHCEKQDDNNHHITLTDLRYYLKDNYMHHATAQFNENFELIQCAFHPYHTGRNSKIPV